MKRMIMLSIIASVVFGASSAMALTNSQVGYITVMDRQATKNTVTGNVTYAWSAVVLKDADILRIENANKYHYVLPMEFGGRLIATEGVSTTTVFNSTTALTSFSEKWYQARPTTAVKTNWSTATKAAVSATQYKYVNTVNISYIEGNETWLGAFNTYLSSTTTAYDFDKVIEATYKFSSTATTKYIIISRQYMQID